MKKNTRWAKGCESFFLFQGSLCLISSWQAAEPENSQYSSTSDPFRYGPVNAIAYDS